MKKRLILYKLVICVTVISLSGCKPPRNFFEDTDDPGLSRLTSREYNIVTAYINDSAYINPYNYNATNNSGGNSPVIIKVIHTNSTMDTLTIAWQIVPNDTANNISWYSNITLSMPVPKSFSASDFLMWNGKRFPQDPTTVTIQLGQYGSATPTGDGSIYFIKLSPDTTYQTYIFSGLFAGNIDGIQITKGRFDFKLSQSDITF